MDLERWSSIAPLSCARPTAQLFGCLQIASDLATVWKRHRFWRFRLTHSEVCAANSDRCPISTKHCRDGAPGALLSLRVQGEQFLKLSSLIARLILASWTLVPVRRVLIAS
jgi:hypothetical protein